MANTIDRHPGDAEADAAIAGMREVYGPAPLPTRGEAIRGTTCGKAWSGQCVFAEPGRVIVEVDDEAYLTVRPSDIER